MSVFSKTMAEKAPLLNSQDVQANRRGDITKAQKQRFYAVLGWRRQVFIIGAAAFVFVSILLLASFPYISSAGLRSNFPSLLLVGWGLFLLLLLYAGRSIWSLWDRVAKFKRDDAGCAIRQGQGQLAYSKKGYTFQAQDRSFAMPANGANGLLPGTVYRVYYLEESGFLLSAEEFYSATPAQVRTAINEILATANGFSFEDLAANQNGRVTPAQRRRPIYNVMLGAVIGLAAFVFLVPFLLPALSSNFTNTPSFLIAVILGGIFLLVGGFMFVNALIDVFISAPQQTQGMAHKKIRVSSSGRSQTTHYYYVIDDQSFEVSKSAYTALIDGLKYRIYYLPRTKRLISIEALEVSPGNP